MLGINQFAVVNRDRLKLFTEKFTLSIALGE
jgi:hypothetical protein